MTLPQKPPQSCSGCSCSVPSEELIQHFFNEAPNPFDESAYNTDNAPPDPSDFTMFTASEKKAKIQKCENTAPGQDRLTYNHWKGIDPDSKAIAQIFKICLRSVPDSWKISITIFIPKESDPTATENWRPNSLSCTLYKVFTSLIAARISK